MAIVYNRRTLIQRIKQHVANGFPDSSVTFSDNEVHLLIDQCIAFTLVGNVYGAAKLSGVLEVPEGYLATFEMSSLLQDDNTGEWYADLPQTVLGLPIGYSITDAYFANPTYGKSQMIFLVKNKRASYRDFMPKPNGVHLRVENQRVYLKANNGQPLSEETLFIQMPSTRSTDLDEIITMPDDAIETVFSKVVEKLLQRMGIPVDTIQDDLPVNPKRQ